MATKRKKPPAPDLEQEAKTFVESKTKKVVKRSPPVDASLSLVRQQLAASVLPGLLVGGGVARAEELVEEAFRDADLILQHNK